MMEAFVSGESRSRDFVNQIESEVATSDLDDDERFSDLQLTLAMFGASDREFEDVGWRVQVCFEAFERGAMTANMAHAFTRGCASAR